MMVAKNLFTELINAGVAPSDAQGLEAAYNTEPDFLDGLETVATLLALKETPGGFPPTGEPWRTIYTSMTDDINAGADLDAAWRKAISIYDVQMQFAITAAVNIRQKAVLDFEAQKNKKKRFKTKDFLNGLAQLGYSFRFNMCTGNIELNGQPITDGDAATIRSLMRDGGFVQIAAMEDAYMADAYRNRYHPVREYLSGLQWDGEPHIQELCTYFTDQYSVFPVWLRKWMIGSCAKVFEAEQNPMLVLDGPQGIGKSEFVKWLASPLKEYFIDSAINPDDKDTDLRLLSMWIWEVSELGATTRKADYEALKAFLTRRHVTVRKPYGRHDIHGPAMASFIGTVNNSSGILSDPTGHRRYMICKLTNIDWTYATEIDVHQIWAEAMAAYLAHEDYRLTPDLRKKQSEIAELYEVDDVIEGLLLKHFKVDPTNSNWWLPTADILKILEDPYQGGLKGTTKGNAMQLAATATRLGLEKKKRTNSNGARVWGYVGITTTP